jgi:hypothetical protein
VHTIRLVSYTDSDALNEILIIGPYDSAATRDADIGRLAGVKGFYGLVELVAAKIPPEAADETCTPDKVAGVATVRQLLAAVNSYDYNPAEDDDLVQAD